MSPAASAPDDDTKSSMHMTMHDLIVPPKKFTSLLLRITKMNLGADRHHRTNERLRTRQGSVGNDMERLGLAVDPEAGFVDMQRRAFRQLGDGGLLP